MAESRNNEDQPRRRHSVPRTAEAYEDHLIDLASRLAERQMMDGTVSSQVQVHYLKLGSSTEKIEKRYKESQIELNRIKADALAAEKRMEEVAAKAVEAMTRYQGRRPPREDVDDDY